MFYFETIVILAFNIFLQSFIIVFLKHSPRQQQQQHQHEYEYWSKDGVDSRINSTKQRRHLGQGELEEVDWS